MSQNYTAERIQDFWLEGTSWRPVKRNSCVKYLTTFLCYPHLMFMLLWWLLTVPIRQIKL